MGIIKNLKVIRGQKFGQLTIIEETDKKKYERQFLCSCECGEQKIFSLRCMVSGETKSCGCLRKKMFINRNTSHGKSRTKLNAVYQSMKQRCNNENHESYNNYGGRGIKICSEWNNDFISFYSWAVENGYKEGLSIERNDVNGNYEPLNCSWITQMQQTRNTRRNINITFNEKTMCIQDWANSLKIDSSTLNKRLKNWDFEKAMTTEKNIKNDTRSNRIRK